MKHIKFYLSELINIPVFGIMASTFPSQNFHQVKLPKTFVNIIVDSPTLVNTLWDYVKTELQNVSPRNAISLSRKSSSHISAATNLSIPKQYLMNEIAPQKATIIAAHVDCGSGRKEIV